jgi:hypothetical protein
MLPVPEGTMKKAKRTRNNPTKNTEYSREFREKVIKYLTRDGNRLIRIGEFLNPGGGIYVLV